MKNLNKYSNTIPYLYFIIVSAYWFTLVNRTEGITAYPILLFGIPFLWQIIKPNKTLNFTLGITFVCLSSYLIFVYILDINDVINFIFESKRLIIKGGLFVFGNLLMALWIIKNSLKRSF